MTIMTNRHFIFALIIPQTEVYIEGVGERLANPGEEANGEIVWNPYVDTRESNLTLLFNAFEPYIA